MPGKYPEYELIRMLIGGDASAFAELYELYKDKVFAFAFALTKSGETAEEVVQEVFIRLWQKREQIDTGPSFNAYLKKITYNLVIDFFRKTKRDKTLQDKLQEHLEALQQTHPDQLMEKQLQRIYQQAIEQLPAQKKKIYLLSREHELSYEEIARETGLSRNTVRNHMTEAIRQIRAYVINHTDIALLILALCMHQQTPS